MTWYRETIVKVCKLKGEDIEKEAALIEEVMRADRPTLDGLDLRQFNRLARAAQAALEDPELRGGYETIMGCS